MSAADAMREAPGAAQAPDGSLSERARPKRCASDEKRRQALELFTHGIGYTRASRILDLSVNTVRDWHRDFRRGVFRTELAENQFRYTKEVRERAVRLRLSGASWTEVTRQTGISASTVRKWVEALKEMRRRGARHRSAHASSPEPSAGGFGPEAQS